MSAPSYAPSPNLSELMRLFTLDANDELLDLPEDGPASPDDALPPPAPAATTICSRTPHVPFSPPQPTELAFRTGDMFPESSHKTFHRMQPSTGGWNSSTQVAKTAAKPLKHQILCRNFVPPAPTVAVDRKTASQLLQRLSKATVSSRMKGSAIVDRSRAHKPIEIDRKRMHLQQRQEAAKRTVVAARDGSAARENTPVRSGREGIELLLFYRKEVEKRLRADPLYDLHQDIQP